MKFHAAVARALADNGVSVIFGLIGDANLYMMDSFVRDQGGRFISAANEAGAAVMALGYASVSGRVGVATVTHGPALTNTLTGLAEGVKARLPIVLLCGDTAAEDRDGLQVIAQRELIVATGAGFEQLGSPATLTRDVATALRRAVEERRPVALNVPVDFQWLDVDYDPILVRIPEMRGFVPAGDDMDNAIGIIAAAKRPVVVAGRGARGQAARASILRLAQRIDAPVGSTLKGNGLFRGEEFDLGTIGTLSRPATVDIVTQSDCLIFFGASVSEHTVSHGSFLKGKRIIHCTIDPMDIGRNFPIDAGLVGDCGLVADAIVQWLDEAEIPPSGYRDAALRQRLNEPRPVIEPNRGTDTRIDLRKALARVDAAFPGDRIVVTDGGRFVRVAWDLIGAPDPASFLYTVHFGSIGLGVAYAIGAALAAPNRPILLVAGDGGFMLGGLVEFNTAVRHEVDLTVVICNDGSYGAEHIQFRRRGMDPALSTFEWPDFAPIASALGGRGCTVRNDGDLEQALRTIEERDRPTLIDLKIDPEHVSEA
jgi:thiamine pyrophosphate-dependent acetolactate synthase large subunit-like protein